VKVVVVRTPVSLKPGRRRNPYEFHRPPTRVFKHVFPFAGKVEAVPHMGGVLLGAESQRQSTLQDVSESLPLERLHRIRVLSGLKLDDGRFHFPIGTPRHQQLESLRPGLFEGRSFVRVVDHLLGRGLAEEIGDLDIHNPEDLEQAVYRDAGLIPLQLRNKAFGQICPVSKLFLGEVTGETKVAYAFANLQKAPGKVN
jgi:hypothetical protein